MSTERLEGSDWVWLLTEPKAVLGPYHGKAPSEQSFAAHSFRCDFDWFALAGQFLELPDSPPSSWAHERGFRADAVFEFLEVRRLEIRGRLQADSGDDSIHGWPVGRVGVFSLTEADDVFLAGTAGTPPRKWKRFSYESGPFNLLLEAAFVEVYPGRRARAQYGWKSDA
jgi:hypothetical protein